MSAAASLWIGQTASCSFRQPPKHGPDPARAHQARDPGTCGALLTAWSVGMLHSHHGALCLPADASGMWQVRVLPGPNAEPDYFTEEDMKTFYSATYSVHYNS